LVGYFICHFFGFKKKIASIFGIFLDQYDFLSHLLHNLKLIMDIFTLYKKKGIYQFGMLVEIF